jgi:glucose/arabinose dehydrogenase/PKD repeat protein
MAALVTVAAFALPAAASAATPPNFQESTAFSGLTSPTAVRFASDGRVFVAEKSGLIKVFGSLSDSTATVFADLRTQVHNFWDRGLLGLALHPNFPTTPHVYVLYTYDKDPFSPTVPRWGMPGATSDPCPNPPGANSDGCVVSGRLSRLTASGDVMTGTEQVLIEDWCQQYPSHSQGSLAFGQDGNLYVSSGDGASFTFTDYGQDGDPTNPCGDPPVPAGGVQAPPTAEGGALRSQDVRSLSDPTGLDGTVLRVDPDTGAGVPGNPLFDSSDPNTRRIMATGLRNPFRFAIRPGTNELWIGDVGWISSEEINRLPAHQARNFGWPCYEGTGHQSGYDSANLSLCEQLYSSTGTAGNLVSGTPTAPYFEYDHAAEVVPGESCPTGASAITGLAFYTGNTFPGNYEDALFFADYSRDCIWVMHAGANGLPDVGTLATFVSGAANPVDVQIGPDGALYYPDFIGGTIRRIQHFPGNQPPVAVATASPTSGPAPLTVAFDGSGSTDADPGDAQTLTYAWDLDGDGQYDDSTEESPTHTYSEAGTYTASLRVTDDKNASGTASITIEAGNTPPVPEIAAPEADTTWRVGERIDFAGSATDAQDGTAPASRLDWDLVMHHCPTSCHEHHIQGFEDTASGFFDAPDHEYPSHLELKLTAADSNGSTASTSIDLDPETVDLTLTSSTPGLNLTLNSSTVSAPFTRTVIEGSTNSISAPSPQMLAGQSYAFESWSDGGAGTHNVVADDSSTYTATYTNHAPSAVATADPTSGVAPLTVDFDGTGSSEPDPGDSIVYAWDLDDDGQYDDSSSPTASRTYPGQGSYDAALRVTDDRGATDTDSVTIVASNTLPLGDGGPTLDLEAEARRNQRAAELAIEVSCPTEPCDLTASGRAKGVQFEPRRAQTSMEPGAVEILRLRAVKRHELERLERYLEEGSQRGPVIAKIEIRGTDLMDGGSATERLKVRLKA